MFINAKCNTCSEPTKYVTGFWDGENGEHGCLHDCKNTECLVNQLHKISESQAMKDRMHIQELNGAKGMYAERDDLLLNAGWDLGAGICTRMVLNQANRLILQIRPERGANFLK